MLCSLHEVFHLLLTELLFIELFFDAQFTDENTEILQLTDSFSLKVNVGYSQVKPKSDVGA